MQASVVGVRTRNLRTTFTEYEISVSHAQLRWTVWRRFSLFSAMRDQLVALNPAWAKCLPPLPKKRIRNNLDEAFIKQRKTDLSKFLAALLSTANIAVPLEVHTSVPVLSFLGVLDNRSSEKKKPAIDIYEAAKVMEPGDVILFRTHGNLQKATRAVLSAEYDHVGVLVRIPIHSLSPDSLYVLEATTDGVTKHPVIHRLMSWHVSDAHMAFRHVNFKRSYEKMRQLADFAEAADGMPYSLEYGLKLLRRVSKVEKTSYFCSELVAASWKLLGLFQEGASASSSVLPKHFADNGKVDEYLADGVTFDKETLLRFDKPGVKYAKARPKHKGHVGGVETQTLQDAVKAEAKRIALGVPDVAADSHRASGLVEPFSRPQAGAAAGGRDGGKGGGAVPGTAAVDKNGGNSDDAVVKRLTKNQKRGTTTSGSGEEEEKNGLSTASSSGSTKTPAFAGAGASVEASPI